MPRWFAWPSELKESGILGINRRNLSYILESNPRRLYPRVDNKLITKSFCEAHGIPVPETYGVFSSQGQVRNFPALVEERNDFVS